MVLIEHTYPLEKEIAELAESIFAVKAQQEYIVVRERQHRDSKKVYRDIFGCTRFNKAAVH